MDVNRCEDWEENDQGLRKKAMEGLERAAELLGTSAVAGIWEYIDHLDRELEIGRNQRRNIIDEKTKAADFQVYQKKLATLVRIRTEALDDRNRELKQEIEERIKIEAALKEARDAAESASRAKSEFLANMSHELRTPLNGILGYTQILIRDQSLTPYQKNAIGTIQNSGHHLLLMINDILDLSKIEARKMDLSFTDFYLSDFLKGIVAIVSVRAEQKGLEIKIVQEGNLPGMIRTDEKRLRQVLLNLLGNAVKFTDKGKIVFCIRRDGHKLIFAIEDTGCGIPQDLLEEIFEPFKQAKSLADKSEGTGLGLAISRRLVRMLGSELYVQSELKKGSCFWFELTPEILEEERGGSPWENHLPKNIRIKMTPEESEMILPPAQEIEAMKEMIMIGDIRGVQRHAERLLQGDSSLNRFCNKVIKDAKGFKIKEIKVFLSEILNREQSSEKKRRG